MSISNIINMYKKASPLDIKEGKEWYPSARKFCSDLSQKYEVPLINVAGVCLLSLLEIDGRIIWWTLSLLLDVL